MLGYLLKTEVTYINLYLLILFINDAPLQDLISHN